MRLIGCAERSLELACARADERVAFGKPLSEQGVVMQQIAESRNEIDQDAPPELAFKVTDPDGNVIDVTGDPGEWRGIEV